MLAHKQGSTITRQENKLFDNHDTDKSKDAQSAETAATAGQPDALPAFRVPPATAIAGVLIRDWAAGKFGAWDAGKSSNL